MKPFRTAAFALLACVALFAGCAANAVSNARVSLDKAKAAGAEAKAPGDFYMAQEYLGLADHEVNEGDSKGAREFAEKSEKYSKEALQKAGGGAK
jgi:hypothetical protein